MNFVVDWLLFKLRREMTVPNRQKVGDLRFHCRTSIGESDTQAVFHSFNDRFPIFQKFIISAKRPNNPTTTMFSVERVPEPEQVSVTAHDQIALLK